MYKDNAKKCQAFYDFLLVCFTKSYLVPALSSIRVSTEKKVSHYLSLSIYSFVFNHLNFFLFSSLYGTDGKIFYGPFLSTEDLHSYVLMNALYISFLTEQPGKTSCFTTLPN